MLNRGHRRPDNNVSRAVPDRNMRLLSRAKINLFLRITGQRADGYHTLFSLMACLDLADNIEIDPISNGISINCDHPAVPCDETNLACRAARLFYDQTGIRPGLSINIDKRSPVAAGLGGGSSNAAAVLKGLNHLYDHPLSRQTLMSLAPKLGADVPFFLMDSPALAEGIGEQLTPYGKLSSLPVVLVVPDIPVSTAEVYKSVDLGLTTGKKFSKLTSFTEETYFDAGIHLANDLERVTTAWHPRINNIINRLKALGAVGSLMSGSGPAVFGLFANTGAAARAGRAFSKKSSNDAAERIYLTRILTGDEVTT